MNPLLTKISGFLVKNVANPSEGILNTALSLVRDKTKDADVSFVREKVKNGISVSSKRVLNLTGTAAIITTALGMMASNGINKMNLLMLALGVAYAMGMSFITAYSERK